MHTVLSALAAMGAMFMKDSIATMLVIMQSRGKARWAGDLAAANDVAGMFVTVTSAGLVIRHGWTPTAVIVLIAMAIMSKIGTQFWTGFGNRKARNGEVGLHELAHTEVPQLAARLTKVERAIGIGDE